MSLTLDEVKKLFEESEELQIKLTKIQINATALIAVSIMFLSSGFTIFPFGTNINPIGFNNASIGIIVSNIGLVFVLIFIRYVRSQYLLKKSIFHDNNPKTFDDESTTLSCGKHQISNNDSTIHPPSKSKTSDKIHSSTIMDSKSQYDFLD